MLKIEHIGIAVKNLSNSNGLFDKLLGSKPYKTEFVESENVKTSFFKVGESKIELLNSSDPENVINKFIAKRGEGMHHIAFLVEEIFSEIERLKTQGFQPLMDKPKIGADNKLVFFFHPKSSNGVLIELCQVIEK